jgi:hypothetical protein
MPTILNKQPIFTATPITVCLGVNLQENTGDTHKTDKATTIYADNTVYGSLITKITINSNAKIGADVSDKRIDLYISDSDNSGDFNLYTSKYMIGINSITQSDLIPSVVFEFPTGLILSPGKILALSTTNAGDLVSIIVEGGTYDQQV